MVIMTLPHLHFAGKTETVFVIHL